MGSNQDAIDFFEWAPHGWTRGNMAGRMGAFSFSGGFFGELLPKLLT